MRIESTETNSTGYPVGRFDVHIDTIREMQRTRRLCGLPHSVGAVKRILMADAKLTPQELESYRRELLKVRP